MSQNKKRSSRSARPCTPGETNGVLRVLKNLVERSERPLLFDPDYLNFMGDVSADLTQLPTRLQVYFLATMGYHQSDIARVLSVRPATVNYHISDQVVRRFLSPQVSRPGYRELRTNPIFYQKGRKGSVIEPLLSGVLPAGRNQLYDKGREFDNPLYCRIHCTNGYTFEILGWRDFNRYELKVGRDILKFPLLPERYYKKTSGVHCFHTHLYYDGEWVPIDAQLSQNKSILRVWPPSAYQTLWEMEADINPFSSMLEGILYPLRRFAGWKLGTGTLSGELHYAFRFPYAERLLPNSFRIPGGMDYGQVWADHSLGQEELETNSRQFAIEWLRALWTNNGGLSKPLEKLVESTPLNANGIPKTLKDKDHRGGDELD